MSIDPAYVAAASDFVLGRTEEGDLHNAYAAAVALTRRRPDSMEAHFALSYVPRFAGLVDEAAAECNTAFLLDPRAQTSGLRSCASVFILRGDYARAATYADLDHGSDFAKAMNLEILGRQRREAEALRLGSPRMPGWNSYDLLLACMAHRPAAQVGALAGAVRVSTDPETNHFVAEHFAYSGMQDKAIAFLTAAIRGGFCSYPAIQGDPYFAGLRMHPQFKTVLTNAEACHSTFVADRNRGTPGGS